MMTEQLTQALAIASAPIHPQSVGVGNADSGGVDMLKFRRAIFILDVGAFGASATVDMKLQGSADNSSFTDLATLDPTLTNVAITQLVAAGGNNRFATLEVRADQLTKITAINCRYVRVRIAVGTAATLLQLLCLGGESAQKPASQYNIAAVAQQAVVGN